MHYLTEALMGLFLCAEPDQAIFAMAFNQFGSNPVETPGNLSPIVRVFVTVESFEQEHPLIRAEVNGLSGCRISHEWALAVSVNGLYCKTRVKGITLTPLHHQTTSETNPNDSFSDGRQPLHQSPARFNHCRRFVRSDRFDLCRNGSHQ